METQILYPQQITTAEKKSQSGTISLLLLVALAIDLFTPYLIWKNVLPSELRWISHGMVALMIVGSISRMIVFNYVPKPIWVILSVAALWTFVALTRGQGILPTLWGLYLFFQFPFVGLFIYLQPDQPKQLGKFLLRAGLIVLFAQVALQLIQYASGEKLGDQLAGLFGRNGTSNAIMFIFILSCLALGHWIVTKRWISLILVLLLGAISSVLGELKLYPFAIVAMSGIAIVISAIRSHSLFRLLRYTVLVMLILVVFMFLYNEFVPSSSRRPIQAFITDPQMLDQYLNQSNIVSKNGATRLNMGRNYAINVGWSTLQDDTLVLLFGYGMGARGESQSLQTSGIGFSRSDVGLTVGTSLLVIMQEMGLVGMVAMLAFFIWVVFALIRDIRQYPRSPLLDVRFAALLFTLLFPVWLWYASIWTTIRVPMLIYWLMLGTVLAETRLPLARLNRQRANMGLDDLGV